MKLKPYKSIYETSNKTFPLKEFKFNTNQLQRGAVTILKALSKRSSVKFSWSHQLIPEVLRKVKGSETLFGVEAYATGKPYRLRVNWSKNDTGTVHSVSLFTIKGKRDPNHTIDGFKPDGSEKSLSELVNEIAAFFKGDYIPQSPSSNREEIINIGGTNLEDPTLNAELDAIFAMQKTMSFQIDRMNRAIERIANPAYPISVLILCGTPGIGKTFNVERILKESGWSKQPGINYLRAKVSPAQAAIALFNSREEGQILVFDDCDDPWSHDNVINLFKSAFDQGTENTVTWKIGPSAGPPPDYPEDGVFNFEGKCIFISNLTKANLIKLGATAVLSRGEMVALDLTPAQVKEYIDVLLPKLMPEVNMPLEEKQEVLNFLSQPRVIEQFPYMSIRLVCNAIVLKVYQPTTWKQDIFNLN